MTRVVSTRAELADRPDLPTAVVMTMGALHAGHAALMASAREIVGSDGCVIVTDFVNPRQFGAGEDFDRYPRTLDADVEVCADAGADIVFVPSVDEVYSRAGTPAAGITVQPGDRGDILEGASRPGHFAGMLTVVAKLLHLTRPDVALFGEKDFQQLVLIRAMAQALDFPVRIVGVETVREPDGLAMSSRNRYLAPAARRAAAAIPEAMRIGQAEASSGARAVEDAVRRHLMSASSSAGVSMDIDYVAVMSGDLDDPPSTGTARLLVAVVVDGTRLIDNVPVHLGGEKGDQ